MSDKCIKVAFIGTDNIAKQHLRYLKEFSDVEIVALYDIEKRA